MGSYEGKTAVVTGGASGIGRAIARALIGRGAEVVVADIDEARLEETRAELGERCHTSVLDVTDASAVEVVVKDAHARRGRLDYIFNNAGIAIIGEVLHMSLDDWGRLYDVNVRGVIHGVAAAYPLMVEQRSGHIVNTASISGLIPAPGFTAYAGTKHAVVGMSVGLRAEAKVHGVKISAVCPGFIDTPIKDNAKMIGVDRETALNSNPIPFYNVDRCAHDTLRGVARNRGVIVVARHAKAMHLAQRLFPGLVERMAARQAAKDHATLVATKD